MSRPSSFITSITKNFGCASGFSLGYGLPWFEHVRAGGISIVRMGEMVVKCLCHLAAAYVVVADEKYFHTASVATFRSLALC